MKNLTGPIGRRERIKDLCGIVEKADSDGVTTVKLQALMDLRHGVGKEKVTTYLETLHESGLIFTDGTRRYSPGSFPRKKLSDFILETRIHPKDIAEKTEMG